MNMDEALNKIDKCHTLFTKLKNWNKESWMIDESETERERSRLTLFLSSSHFIFKISWVKSAAFYSTLLIKIWILKVSNAKSHISNNQTKYLLGFHRENWFQILKMVGTTQGRQRSYISLLISMKLMKENLVEFWQKYHFEYWSSITSLRCMAEQRILLATKLVERRLRLANRRVPLCLSIWGEIPQERSDALHR